MNWEGYWRKLLCPNLKCRPEILLEGPKKSYNMYWEQPDRRPKLETATFRMGRWFAKGLIVTSELWRLGCMDLVS